MLRPSATLGVRWLHTAKNALHYNFLFDITGSVPCKFVDAKMEDDQASPFAILIEEDIAFWTQR